MYKILIVEDDQTISVELKNHINAWGYEAKCVENFQNVLLEFAAFNPHIILLDISLPFYNGYHWCTEIRKLSKVPIIFISSASDNMNIVMALSQGGDEFVSKPFDLNVLTVKIKALLRRTYDFAGSSDLIEHNGVILDIGKSVVSCNGNHIELSKNELRILQILFENNGKAVSRDDIIKRLWETDSYIDDNTLTVNMTRLRKRLFEIDLTDLIVTKKGIGYMVE